MDDMEKEANEFIRRRYELKKELYKMIGNNGELILKSVSIPQFKISNFCMCKECKDRNIELALDVVIEIPRDELFDTISKITLMDDFCWEEVPFEVVIRPCKRDKSEEIKEKEDKCQ